MQTRNPHITCLSLDCPERKGGRCVGDKSGKLTSDQWHELTKKTEAIITEPKAWGGTLNHSWYNDKISYLEYCDKRNNSKCIFNPDFVKLELELSEMTHTKPALPDYLIDENIVKFKPRICQACGKEYKLWHEECLHEDLFTK